MTGRDRFNTYLQQWESLAANAASSVDPAEFVLNNNGRTIFFMAESLCKIYKSLHNEKLFIKQGEKFKLIEDLLGEMDHYRECIDEFSSKEEILPSANAYFKEKYDAAKLELNTVFKEKGWLNGKRTTKIRRKMEAADWMEPKKEMNAIRKYYLAEIEEVKALYQRVPVFTVLEDQLHEFRRRLRWFSIYPHALQGSIQLTSNNQGNTLLEKYQTPEILSSPFNKFPEPGNQSHVLLLEKNNFLALSWMIDALGKLKDRGLMSENLLEALEKTSAPNDTFATKQVRDEILREGTAITRAFMEEKVLDGLVGEVKELPATA